MRRPAHIGAYGAESCQRVDIASDGCLQAMTAAEGWGWRLEGQHKVRDGAHHAAAKASFLHLPRCVKYGPG